MGLMRVSLLLRWSRPRPLGARVAVIDRSRVYWNTIVGRSTGTSTSRERQFVLGQGRRPLCSSSAPFSSDACEDVRVDGLPSLREYMATLGVFFTLPEQGVTSPEILTRCEHLLLSEAGEAWRLLTACTYDIPGRT